MQQLDQAIYDTVRYFDMFDMPLTATQIWQCLIIDAHGDNEMRWGGHAQYRLSTIQSRLKQSDSLLQAIDTQWGYYALRGRKDIVRTRLDRHARAQQKWKITRKAARLLAAVPFVRALAGSGSLAADNTKEDSDLDIFVIAKRDRIWTARLGLAVAAQLLGRRRKYWNTKAPDKLCLNHYITEEALSIAPEIRNIYTASLYTLLIPMTGSGLHQKFLAANASWIHRYVMSPDMPLVRHQYAVRPPGLFIWLKTQLENILLEPAGAVFEAAARSLQMRAMRRHQQPGRAGRIKVSSRELAFHPDTKVPALLARFYQDPGQGSLFDRN